MATKTMEARDVDVSGVTQEEFLQGLNVDLAHELPTPSPRRRRENT